MTKREITTEQVEQAFADNPEALLDLIERGKQAREERLRAEQTAEQDRLAEERAQWLEAHRLDLDVILSPDHSPNLDPDEAQVLAGAVRELLDSPAASSVIGQPPAMGPHLGQDLILKPPHRLPLALVQGNWETAISDAYRFVKNEAKNPVTLGLLCRIVNEARTWIQRHPPSFDNNGEFERFTRGMSAR